MPVEAPAAALVAVAHLRVMHRHHPIPAHPVLEADSVISALHILDQQPAKAVDHDQSSTHDDHCALLLGYIGYRYRGIKYLPRTRGRGPVTVEVSP